jgi:DNA-binding transcriptional LysR family regulator
MTANLDDLALFVAVAEAGSLAAAARAAGLPKSSVSRRLAALEARLATGLMKRTTRRLALTDAGRALFERCQPLVRDLRAAEADLAQAPAQPRGRLRITATGAFGRYFVGPAVGDFLAAHPDVSAELVLLDRPVDIVTEGFDLAVRMGPVADSALRQRKLTDIERVLCAAPSYLGRTGPIDTLAALGRRDAVTSLEGNSWSFTTESGARTIKPPSRFIGNQLETLLDAAERGCGTAVLPLFLAAEALATGRLVRLLEHTPPTPGSATLLWAAERFLPAHTRAFIDHLVARTATLGS